MKNPFISGMWIYLLGYVGLSALGYAYFTYHDVRTYGPSWQPLSPMADMRGVWPPGPSGRLETVPRQQFQPWVGGR